MTNATIASITPQKSHQNPPRLELEADFVALCVEKPLGELHLPAEPLEEDE